MSLVMLHSQATIPGAELPAPENRTCPLPKWLYPADSPCRNQDKIFQNSDVFNIEKGVKAPAREVGQGIVNLKNEASDTVSGIISQLKKLVIVGGVILVGYLALNIYALVKK